MRSPVKTSSAARLEASALRHFGLLMAAFVPLSFGLLLPWLLSFSWPLWPWLVSLAFAAVALLRPAWLGPIHRAWMVFAHGLGWLNSRLILGLTFFLIITPIGILLRLFGRDPLCRRFDPRSVSYRNPRAHAPEPAEMERPF